MCPIQRTVLLTLMANSENLRALIAFLTVPYMLQRE